MIEAKLCAECGLCCNGSLFADVELTPRECDRMEAMGFNGSDDGEALIVQPCGALRGTRCGIYQFRPRCCRTFECRILQEAKRGIITLSQAKARVAEAKKAIAEMPQPSLDRYLCETFLRDGPTRVAPGQCEER